MISDCCGERVIDHWNTWEGMCSSCKEHCWIQEEENQDNRYIDEQVKMFKMIGNLFTKWKDGTKT